MLTGRVFARQRGACLAGCLSQKVWSGLFERVKRGGKEQKMEMVGPEDYDLDFFGGDGEEDENKVDEGVESSSGMKRRNSNSMTPAAKKMATQV